jgi:hypothetical protein
MADLKPGRTDRQVLSALLLSGGLTPTEERAFRSMFDALEKGQLKLTPPQRMWADQIFLKLKLDKVSTNQRLISEAETNYDKIVKNRPLKPPGRK